MPYADPDIARARSAGRMRRMRLRRDIAAATADDLAAQVERIMVAFDRYLGLAGAVAARELAQTLTNKVTPKAVAKRGRFRRPVQIDLEGYLAANPETR